MPLQTRTTGLSPQDAYGAIRDTAQEAKAQAQNALISLQNGAVTTDFVFRLLDRLMGLIASLNAWKTVAGLDAYATAQQYTGTLSADCTTCVTNANACITWVVTFFPSSGGFLQAYALNADGTRTPRSFSNTQTAGLQTVLSTLINSIG